MKSISLKSLGALCLICSVLLFITSCQKEEPTAPASSSDASVVLVDEEVYTGTGYQDWEALDVSSVVGKNAARVTFKVKNLDMPTQDIVFRTFGDPEDYSLTAQFGSAKMWRQDHSALAEVFTNADGKVEWKTENATDVSISVVAYIK